MASGALRQCSRKETALSFLIKQVSVIANNARLSIPALFLSASNMLECKAHANRANHAKISLWPAYLIKKNLLLLTHLRHSLKYYIYLIHMLPALLIKFWAVYSGIKEYKSIKINN